jgi:hypothetical protein
MKKKNKKWLIIGLIGAVLLVYWFYFRKKTPVTVKSDE